MSLLKIEQLERHYPNFDLGPLNLSIKAGEAIGLVGANGAGKSTLFRLLMGLVRKHGGEIEIASETVQESNAEWRQLLGYVGDVIPLFDSWSGQKNLDVLSRFYPDWSTSLATELAGRLQLNLSQKVGSYSTGQRTKLGIILALAHRPALLLLDEAANGLDPVSRELFVELLFEAMAGGETAIVYASHHVNEIESLIDRVIFLNQGQIIADAIKEDLTEDWRKISFRSEQALTEIPRTVHERREDPYREIISSKASETLSWLQDNGIQDVQCSRLSLEKISIEILKNPRASQSPAKGSMNHV